MWISGQWRAVSIDDRMPVDASGELIILSSPQERELWPTLLAKALYKLYSVSSFGTTHHDFLDASFHRIEGVSITCASVLTSFLAFGTQALTGWIPEIFHDNSLPIMDEVLPCTPSCPSAKFYVNTEYMKLVRWSKMSAKKKRKKRIKKEVTPEELEESAHHREKNIEEIRKMLAAPRPDIFFICFATKENKSKATPSARTSFGATGYSSDNVLNHEDNTQSSGTGEDLGSHRNLAPRAKMYPILAVGLDKQNDGSDPQLLINWDPSDELPSGVHAADDSSFLNWVYWSDLKDEGGVLLKMNTLVQMPHRQTVQYYWLLPTTDEPEDNTGMGGRHPRLTYPGQFPRHSLFVPGSLKGPTRLIGHLLCDPNRSQNSQSNAKLVLYRTPLPPSSDETIPPTSLPPRIDISCCTVQPYETLNVVLPPCHNGHLFNLTLDAPAGACLTFASSADIVSGSTDMVWKHVGGFHTSAVGHYPIIVRGHWQVIFRKILRIPKISLDEADSEEEEVVMMRLTVDIEDAGARPYMRLVTIDNDTGVETVHPLLETAYTLWSPNEEGYTVLVTCYSPMYDIVGVRAEDEKDDTHVDDQVGSWTLNCFSNKAIESLVDVPCGVSTRFRGAYTRNKYLLFFRDVIRTTTDLRFSLRLEISDPTIFIRVKILTFPDSEKGTPSEVVMERSGHSVVTLHSVMPPMQEEGDPDTGPSVIVEGSLDAEHMDVSGFLSRRPYYFDANSEESETAVNWLMTISSPSAVIVEHDVTQERAQAAIRLAWEEPDPGRAQRAQQIRQLYLQSGDTQSSDYATQRADALGGLVSADLELNRVHLRAQLPVLEEMVVTCQGRESTYVDANALQARIEGTMAAIAQSLEEIKLEDGERESFYVELDKQFLEQEKAMLELRRSAAEAYEAEMKTRDKYLATCLKRDECAKFLHEMAENAILTMSDDPNSKPSKSAKKR